jgi:NitT/TauT family transport system substrate-binding protein
MHTIRRLVTVLVAVALGTGAVACTRLHRDQPVASDQGPAAEVRLGYFANVTHASALIGVRQGFFTRQLGRTRLRTQLFDSGPDEASALLGGSLDVAFIGPGPAINAYSQSDGTQVRLVAGATSGGAELVARAGIRSAADLNGRTVATPQLGNTQDIALKTWADRQHVTGMKVLNSANPQILAAFRGGQIDAAWVPEPWASQLVLQAGAHVLVDERSLWPRGRFPSTVILVRTQFLQEHRQTVEALLRGVLGVDDWARSHTTEARAVVNGALAQATGKPLPTPVLARAFSEVALDTDPLTAQLGTTAKDAVTAGVAARVPDLTGFVDTSVLKQAERSVPEGSGS